MLTNIDDDIAKSESSYFGLWISSEDSTGAFEERVSDSVFKPLNVQEIQDSNFNHMSHTCVHIRVKWYSPVAVQYSCRVERGGKKFSWPWARVWSLRAKFEWPVIELGFKFQSACGYSGFTFYWGWDSRFKFESQKNGWDSRLKFSLQGP